MDRQKKSQVGMLALAMTSLELGAP